LVEAIYDGAGRVALGSTVTYEDGRVAQVKAELRILDIPNGGGR
jgi:hypothetical protein